MKIVVASDSFKGSLTSHEVGAAFADGFLQINPNADIRIVPISDGGDGLIDAIYNNKTCKLIETNASDPLGRQIEAKYILDNDVAIIESAAACGLTLLSESERNPLNTSSRGVGELICDALARGVRRIFIGLGGSATNDGGVGMLMALGYEFLNSSGRSINEGGGGLSDLTEVRVSNVNSLLCCTEIIIASDVMNPLCGRFGASYIYSPQKGADREMTEILEENMQHYSAITKSYLGADYSDIPGSGAGGGLGFGLLAYLKARIRSGIESLMDLIDFDHIIADADLVVTGEGAIDGQTIMGKAPMGVLKRSMQHGTPVIAIAGRVENCIRHLLKDRGFYEVIEVTPIGMPMETALSKEVAMLNVKNTAIDIAKMISSDTNSISKE